MSGQSAAVIKTKRKFLHLDPRTGILLTITISCIMIGGGTERLMVVLRPCLSAIPVFLLLTERKLRTALGYGAFLGLAFAAEQCLIPFTRGFICFLLVAVVSIVARIMPGILMGYYVMTTTEASEFIASMKRMRLPDAVIIPISVIFRFFPTVKEEARDISIAMRMRNIKLSGIFFRPIEILEYCLVPLMVSVVRIGEELTVAALTRGLGAPVPRTSICKVEFRRADLFMGLLALCAWAIFATSALRRL